MAQVHRAIFLVLNNVMRAIYFIGSDSETLIMLYLVQKGFWIPL